MSQLNHQRRRNRTFRVEALESRALLSTAAVVARPAAAVAPLARFAPSSIAGDPAYSATFEGTLIRSDRKKEVILTFSTVGTVSSNPTTGPGSQTFAGGSSTFKGEVERFESKGTVKYINGTGDVISPSGTDELGIRFHGTKSTKTFSWTGHVFSGKGVFDRAMGTFSGAGTFTGTYGETGTIGATIEIKFMANAKLKV
jgi:hypothetical protein